MTDENQVEETEIEESRLERSIRSCEESGAAFRDDHECGLEVVYRDARPPDYEEDCTVECHYCGIEASCDEDGE